jgi:putative flippase GtrA
VLAFGISEATLLVLYGSGAVGATMAALIANVVATVPSYLLSRYWIWKEATRTRVGRQIVLYWATSVACIAGTSVATGAIARLAPVGNPWHLAVVGLGFLIVSVVFWLTKFIIYQRVIFPLDERSPR